MPGISEEVVRRNTRNPVTAYSPSRALTGGRTANAGTPNRVTGAWGGSAQPSAGPLQFNMGQTSAPRPVMTDWLTMSEQARQMSLPTETGGEMPGGWKGVLGHAVNNPFGKVVLGGLQALDIGRRFVVSTLDETIDAIRPGEEFDADLGEWWDKLTTADYGFGDLFREQVGTTGNNWIDRGIGFVGDVLLDPLTYVGGSSFLTGTGRAARIGLAGEAELANLGAEIVGKAGRIGVSAFDDEARAVLRAAGSKIRPSGYYFKVPFSGGLRNPLRSEFAGLGIRLPLTGGLERMTGRVFAGARARLAGGSLGRAIARGSIDEIIEPAYRRLITGEGDLSASEAAAFAAGYDELKRASQEFAARGTEGMRSLNKRFGGADGLNAMINKAETEGGTPLNDIYKVLAEMHTKATGQELNSATFIPHILSNDAVEALFKKGDATLDAVRAEFFPGLSLKSISPHLETRLLVPRDKPFKILGREMTILENSIDGVNDAWRRAFPEYKFDLLESNINQITKRYVDSMAQSVGKASMIRHMAESRSTHAQRLGALADKGGGDNIDAFLEAVSRGVDAPYLKRAAKAAGKRQDELLKAMNTNIGEARGNMVVLERQALEEAEALPAARKLELDGFLAAEGSVKEDIEGLTNAFGKAVDSLDTAEAKILSELSAIGKKAAQERQDWLANAPRLRSGHLTDEAVNERLVNLKRYEELQRELARISQDRDILANIGQSVTRRRAEAERLKAAASNDAILDAMAHGSVRVGDEFAPGQGRRVNIPESRVGPPSVMEMSGFTAHTDRNTLKMLQIVQTQRRRLTEGIPAAAEFNDQIDGVLADMSEAIENSEMIFNRDHQMLEATSRAMTDIEDQARTYEFQKTHALGRPEMAADYDDAKSNLEQLTGAGGRLEAVKTSFNDLAAPLMEQRRIVADAQDQLNTLRVQQIEAVRQAEVSATRDPLPDMLFEALTRELERQGYAVHAARHDYITTIRRERVLRNELEAAYAADEAIPELEVQLAEARARFDAAQFQLDQRRAERLIAPTETHQLGQPGLQVPDQPRLEGVAVAVEDVEYLATKVSDLRYEIVKARQAQLTEGEMAHLEQVRQSMDDLKYDRRSAYRDELDDFQRIEAERANQRYRPSQADQAMLDEGEEQIVKASREVTGRLAQTQQQWDHIARPLEQLEREQMALDVGDVIFERSKHIESGERMMGPGFRGDITGPKKGQARYKQLLDEYNVRLKEFDDTPGVQRYLELADEIAKLRRGYDNAVAAQRKAFSNLTDLRTQRRSMVHEIEREMFSGGPKTKALKESARREAEALARIAERGDYYQALIDRVPTVQRQAGLYAMSAEDTAKLREAYDVIAKAAHVDSTVARYGRVVPQEQAGNVARAKRVIAEIRGRYEASTVAREGAEPIGLSYTVEQRAEAATLSARIKELSGKHPKATEAQAKELKAARARLAEILGTLEGGGNPAGGSAARAAANRIPESLDELNGIYREIVTGQAPIMKAPPGTKKALETSFRPAGGGNDVVSKAKQNAILGREQLGVVGPRLVADGAVPQELVDQATALANQIYEPFTDGGLLVRYQNNPLQTHLDALENASNQLGRIIDVMFRYNALLDKGLEPSDRLGSLVTVRVIKEEDDALAKEAKNIRLEMEDPDKVVRHQRAQVKQRKELNRRRETQLKRIANQEERLRIEGRNNPRIIRQAQANIANLDQRLADITPDYGPYTETIEAMVSLIEKSFYDYAEAHTAWTEARHFNRDFMNPVDKITQSKAQATYLRGKLELFNAENQRLQAAVNQAVENGADTIRYVPLDAEKLTLSSAEARDLILSGNVPEYLLPELERKMTSAERSIAKSINARIQRGELPDSALILVAMPGGRRVNVTPEYATWLADSGYLTAAETRKVRAEVTHSYQVLERTEKVIPKFDVDGVEYTVEEAKAALTAGQIPEERRGLMEDWITRQQVDRSRATLKGRQFEVTRFSEGEATTLTIEEANELLRLRNLDDSVTATTERLIRQYETTAAALDGTGRQRVEEINAILERETLAQSPDDILQPAERTALLNERSELSAAIEHEAAKSEARAQRINDLADGGGAFVRQLVEGTEPLSPANLDRLQSIGLTPAQADLIATLISGGRNALIAMREATDPEEFQQIISDLLYVIDQDSNLASFVRGAINDRQVAAPGATQADQQMAQQYWASEFAEGTQGPAVQLTENDYGQLTTQGYLADSALEAYTQQIVMLAIKSANDNRLEQGRVMLDRLRTLGFDIKDQVVLEKEMARFGYVGERIRRDIIRDRVMESSDLAGLDVMGGYRRRLGAIEARRNQLRMLERGLGRQVEDVHHITDPVKFWTIWNELGVRAKGGDETRFSELLDLMLPPEVTQQIDAYAKVLTERMKSATAAGDEAAIQSILAEAEQLRLGNMPAPATATSDVVAPEAMPTIEPLPPEPAAAAPEPMVVPGQEAGPSYQEMEPGLQQVYETKLQRQQEIVQRLTTIETDIANAQHKAAAPVPTGASPLDELRDAADNPVRKPPKGQVTTAQWLLAKHEVDLAKEKVAAAADSAITQARSDLADAQNRLNEVTSNLWDKEPEEISQAAARLYEQVKAGADTATIDAAAPDSEAATLLRNLTEEKARLTDELGEVRTEIARIKAPPPTPEAAAAATDVNVLGPVDAAPGPPEQQVAAAAATDAKAKKPTMPDDAKVSLSVLVQRREKALAELQVLQAVHKSVGSRDAKALADQAAKVRELTEMVNARRRAIQQQKMTADTFGNQVLRTHAPQEKLPAKITHDWLGVLRGGIPVRRTEPRTLSGQVRGLTELRPMGVQRRAGSINEVTENMLGARLTRYKPGWAAQGPRGRLAGLARRRGPLLEAQEQLLTASKRATAAADELEGSVAERAARAAMGPDVERQLEEARLATRTPAEEFAEDSAAYADLSTQTQAKLVELQSERRGLLPELEASRRARDQLNQQYNDALASENIALGEVRAEVTAATANLDQAKARVKELKSMFTYEKRSKSGKLLAKAKMPENGMDGQRLIKELQNLLADNPTGVDGVAETAALLDAAARQANNLQAATDDYAMYTARLKEFSDASEKVGQVIKGLVKDGWTPVAEKLLVGSNAVMMSKHLADVMNSVVKTTSDGKFWRALDTYTSFFKTYAIMRPGFHVRNSMGGTFMNLVDGVKLRNIIEAPHIVRAWAKDPEGYLAAAPERIRMAFEAVWGSGATGQFMEEGVGRARAGAGKATSRVLNNKLTRLNARAGGYTEQSIRMAMALDSMDRGLNVHQALRRIRKYHFDYSQVSSLDRTMRRIIPFWTFMSRNLPLQLEQMWLRPRTYLQYQSLQRNFGQEMDPLTPEYWLSQGVWTLDENAEHRDAPWYLAPDLPHLKMMEPFDTAAQGNLGKALLSDLNPAILAPIESLGIEEDIYSGRSLEGYEQPTLPMQGIMALLNMIPGQTADTGSGGQVVKASTANLIRSLIPPWDQAERYLNNQGVREGRQDETFLRAMGLPVYQLNDALRRNTARGAYYDRRDELEEMQALARM